MIVFDSGPLVAVANTADPLHAKARRLVDRAVAGELGAAVTTDFVLDEALTLLQSRKAPARAVDAVLDLLGGGAGETLLGYVATNEEVLLGAAAAFRAAYPGTLSLTDWTLVLVARHFGAQVATFDAALADHVDVVP